ncbi:MAG: pyridoxal-phosphate dependent enzyme, partial [Candidatus Korarchaeota archaeon NZ13-K]
SPLELVLEDPFDRDQVHRGDHTIWRYSRFLPPVTGRVSLGEGWTPLVRIGDLHLKLDFLNPTGSFKDRGSSVLISLVAEGVRSRGGYVSEDSSGNAGASIAAYSARAGLKARIYVPENASGPKLQQIAAYGAEIVRVSGRREDVTRAAMSEEEGKFYIGHVYHPAFWDAMRTLAYEIAEQTDWKPPSKVFLPVSAGTLLLGVLRGFKHLLSSGELDRAPEVIACQTREVSPLYHRMRGLPYSPPSVVRSVADALISPNPPLLGMMVEELRGFGDADVAEEEEIVEAHRELARLGIYVEPSSAVAYAVYRRWLREGRIEGEALVILTGMGLKRSALT